MCAWNRMLCRMAHMHSSTLHGTNTIRRIGIVMKPQTGFFLFCLYLRWMWERVGPLNRFDTTETDAAATAECGRRKGKECFIFIARVLNRNRNPRTARASSPPNFFFLFTFSVFGCGFCIFIIIICVRRMCTCGWNGVPCLSAVYYSCIFILFVV